MDAVDVVIVHYDTPSLLRRCLAVLSDLPGDLLGQVVVVDNASPNSSLAPMPAEFPRVEFQCNQDNLGFATACNQGIAATRSRYCLLLNPDALVSDAALRALRASMEDHAEAGAVAPRMANPDGSLQWSCRRFPNLRAVLLRASRLDGIFPGPVDEYLMRDWDHDEVRIVDWAIGGCLLLRRAAVEEVGLLDEGFFMYYEDADLGRRLQAKGWAVYYEPSAVVRHEHRRESAQCIPGRAACAHLRSLVRLFRKHRLPLW